MIDYINEENVLEMKDVIKHLSILNNGDWDAIYNDVKSKRQIDKRDIADNKNGMEFITLVDSNYPTYLKKSYKPPFVVFYLGNFGYLEDPNKILAILNDNLATSYAYDTIERICADLVDDVIFAIGFGQKKNNDLIRKLLDRKAKIIAIVTCVNEIKEDLQLYEKLCKEQLVITETPLNVLKKNKKLELQACRLQVGIARNILVGGTTKKSPQTCAIGYASAQNETRILCVPFPAGSNYVSNSLIKNGAKLVENGKDVLGLIIG